MQVKKGQLFELDILDIAFGGKGLARIDGMVVFVDQTVAGDRVLARIVRKKKQYAEARVETLLSPSVDRITPPCPYSGFCGGCKLQFLRYEKQLEFKRRHVADCLAHIGLVSDVVVNPAIGSERIFEYRNKMEFSCSDRRWLLPGEMGQERPDMDFALGLHVPGTFDRVLDTEACLLQPAFGNRLLAEVRGYMKSSGAPAYGLRSHAGFWRFLMLRHSVARNQWMVNIVTSARDSRILQPLADRLSTEYGSVVSVVNNVTAGRAAVSLGESEHCLAGSPTIVDAIGSYEFEISANSFFQTNTRGAGRLYDTVRQYADLRGTETVLDLYCGTGSIAICLSDRAARVFGIEVAPSAVADAVRNCARNRISNCAFVQGDMKDCLPRIDARPEVMIIDPPRVGMHKDVVQQVLAMGPERIIYVSCNPATLARDLAELKERYRILEVQPVDMFPHTFHIEAVARLEKI